MTEALLCPYDTFSQFAVCLCPDISTPRPFLASLTTVDAARAGIDRPWFVENTAPDADVSNRCPECHNGIRRTHLTAFLFASCDLVLEQAFSISG